MQINKVHISNLRNHLNNQIEFNPNLNVFFGVNGAGKTTILEAISIACLSKTFTISNETALIKQDEDNYSVNLEATDHLNLPYRVSVCYKIGERKRIANTFSENLNPKDIIVITPLIYLSPDQKNITSGSPENRREFIDRILSQSSKTYLDSLFKFRKTLKQRNSMLNDFKKNGFFNQSIYESWTNLFINIASQIILKRFEFLNEFNSYFKSAYSEITKNNEDVELTYEPHGINLTGNFVQDLDFIKHQLEDKADLRLNAEIARGITLFGPQKDEMKIVINGGLSRERASQGQHKSLLIALIFSEFEYLLNNKNETPIVLLDDIFSELDEFRTTLVLERVLAKNAQTFVTLTNPDVIKRKIDLRNKVSYFELVNGNVRLEL